MTLQEKWLFGCLWHRSRSWIQELELTTSSLRQNSSWASFSATFSVIALYQSSCLNLHCKLKSAKVSADLCLDKTGFLVMAYRKQPTLCSSRLWNGKERPEKHRPLVSWSTLLRWPPQGLQLWPNASLSENSNSLLPVP